MFTSKFSSSLTERCFEIALWIRLCDTVVNDSSDETWWLGSCLLAFWQHVCLILFIYLFWSSYSGNPAHPNLLFLDEIQPSLMALCNCLPQHRLSLSSSCEELFFIPAVWSISFAEQKMASLMLFWVKWEPWSTLSETDSCMCYFK